MAHRELTSLTLTWVLMSWAPVQVHASPDIPMCVSDLVGVFEVPVSIARPWANEVCGPFKMPAPVVESSPLSARAVMAYRKAMELILDAQYEEARLQLDLAEQGLPRIRDYIALKKARLELLRHRPSRASEFFAQATESPHESVRVEASHGYVLALLRANDPDADRALHDLLWTYPALPAHTELLFEHAQGLLRRAQPEDAANSFHGLRVNHPGSHLARRAELALDRLARLGHLVPVLTDEERVQIARQLVRTGPLDRAKAVVGELLAQPLAAEQAAEANYLAGRLARYEGRWQAAETYLRTAQQLPPPDADTARAIESRVEDMSEAAGARRADAARVSLDRMLAGRSYSSVSSIQVRDMIRVAAPAGLRVDVDDMLIALSKRDRVSSAILFDATMSAIGTGGEGLIIVLLDRIAARGGSYRGAALYHLARAHERAGRPEQARLYYDRALEGGDDYYALWATNGVARLEGFPSLESPEGFAELGGNGIPRAPQAGAEQLADRLDEVAELHEETYPWIGRAAALLRIGELAPATGELFETYLTWRHALGRPVARAGLDSVARDDSRVHEPVASDVRVARLGLSQSDRQTLSFVSASLGDVGTAGGFAGPSFIESLPRAYEWLVVPAANRYGLDPNLLLAVMRVESAYQKHIVSYAGAVGLMQIMPRTGQLIAHALGHDDFSPADLLDPKTNLEFAAWYLTSLLRRFDGRLPLAIASYNGGPHNVRRWIQESPDGAPVDVLLERIPFTQTHRYVRRVLVHYEAYRAQQGLSAPKLSVRLPAPRVDPLAF